MRYKNVSGLKLDVSGVGIVQKAEIIKTDKKLNPQLFEEIVEVEKVAIKEAKKENLIKSKKEKR